MRPGQRLNPRTEEPDLGVECRWPPVQLRRSGAGSRQKVRQERSRRRVSPKAQPERSTCTAGNRPSTSRQAWEQTTPDWRGSSRRAHTPLRQACLKRRRHMCQAFVSNLWAGIFPRGAPRTDGAPGRPQAAPIRCMAQSRTTV